MEERAPDELIPDQEITLLLEALDEALQLAHTGKSEEGRELLRRGREQSLLWKLEPWGPALTRQWDRTMRNFEVWME